MSGGPEGFLSVGRGLSALMGPSPSEVCRLVVWSVPSGGRSYSDLHQGLDRVPRGSYSGYSVALLVHGNRDLLNISTYIITMKLGHDKKGGSSCSVSGSCSLSSDF